MSPGIVRKHPLLSYIIIDVPELKNNLDQVERVNGPARKNNPNPKTGDGLRLSC